MHRLSEMSAAEFENDFRREAVEASLRLVAESDAEDPLNVAASLCLPTGNPPKAVNRIIRSHIACWVFGAAGGLAFVQIAAWRDRLPPAARSELLLVVMAISLIGGVGCLGLSLFGDGLFVRSCLRERLNRLKTSADIQDFVLVHIDDSSRFWRQALWPTDFAYVGLDLVNRRIIIEGIVCRYIVWADDVIVLQTLTASMSIGSELAYRIGDAADLSITLQQCAGWSEIAYLTLRIKRDPLLTKLQQTLATNGQQ